MGVVSQILPGSKASIIPHACAGQTTKLEGMSEDSGFVTCRIYAFAEFIFVKISFDALN